MVSFVEIGIVYNESYALSDVKSPNIWVLGFQESDLYNK